MPNPDDIGKGPTRGGIVSFILGAFVGATVGGIVAVIVVAIFEE